MADYKETTKSMTCWQRCYRITIENPYGAMPTVRFDEEMRTNIDGQTVASVTGCITRDFDDPKHVFALRNPATGDPTGIEMTHGDVYAVLWSLYMSLAAERDAAQS